MPIVPSRRAVLGRRATFLLPALLASPAIAADLPRRVPPGTRLVAADQNQALQTMMQASGEHGRLAATVTYANFLGGPAILEAFRAGALDLGIVGNTPPIQAHAAGERIPVIAARTSTEPDYKFAVRPGLTVATLKDFAGKRIAYAEGTGRQPFVLRALQLAGLTRRDVRLVPLRVSDFPDAVRGGQVDLAPLNEPHFSRYLAQWADRGASALPADQHAELPRRLSYLYASGRALDDPAKAAALRDFVIRWIAASRWSKARPEEWVQAYYVRLQNLRPEDGRAIEASEGEYRFPPLSTLIAPHQATIDLIHAAGDIPRRLDAREEFDLRFDAVIAEHAA